MMRITSRFTQYIPAEPVRARLADAVESTRTTWADTSSCRPQVGRRQVYETTTAAPEEIEEYRERAGRRERPSDRNRADAERFIEGVGSPPCLTDSRRPGPSLYVAVCGRRDAVMPRNVQKDEEASHTWHLKDEIIRRSNVYYAKLARGKTMFIAPRMIPHFHAVWGVRKSEEIARLSRNARAIHKVLRKEWEMGSADLRDESGIKDRKAFNRELDELQAAMVVVPSEVLYRPKFTYMDARRRPFSRRAAADARVAPAAAVRKSRGLPRQRRDDAAGRDGARDRHYRDGNRPWQPSAGRRRLRHDAVRVACII